MTSGRPKSLELTQTRCEKTFKLTAIKFLKRLEVKKKIKNLKVSLMSLI